MEKFYGQFDPPVDRVIFERYFPDKNIQGVFIECGAFDGLAESCCKFFEETMGWRGYNFEPVPWVYEKLVANRPLARNLNLALSNTCGEVLFTAYNHPVLGENFGNGSIKHTEAHRKWLEENGCTPVEVTVQTVTWNEFIAAEGVSHVDLLVLDVEGHEMSVLEGMTSSSILPDVICIEAGHLGIDGIRDRLSELGYAYDISSFVNLFFVKIEKLALFAARRADQLQSKLAEIEDEASRQMVALNALTALTAGEVHQSGVTIENLRQDVARLDQRSVEAEAALKEESARCAALREDVVRLEYRANLAESALNEETHRTSGLKEHVAILELRASTAEFTLSEIYRSKSWAALSVYRRLVAAILGKMRSS